MFGQSSNPLQLYVRRILSVAHLTIHLTQALYGLMLYSRLKAIQSWYDNQAALAVMIKAVLASYSIAQKCNVSKEEKLQ